MEGFFRFEAYFVIFYTPIRKIIRSRGTIRSKADFQDRRAWGHNVTGTEVGIGGTVPRGTVADAGYRMDDNFKLAFLLNDSY